MEKIYVYKNATVRIQKPTPEQLLNIEKATNDFWKRIVKERNKNGYYHTGGNIKEK